MNIVCPHCNFSKTIEPATLPDRPLKVNCPKCKASFTFDKQTVNGEASAQTAPRQAAAEPHRAGESQGHRIICNGCGSVQEPAGQCRHCGATMMSTANPVQKFLYAGFWVRVTAYILDSILLVSVQSVLSLAINMIIGMLGIVTEGDPSLGIVLWLFSAALGIGYAVFFTGYCGQTPGKMALRIKVVRTDGTQLSYGRAAWREVPGKFISSVLLGLGYLMVAFDNKKQGLHDKIADTYVIKL